jgi:pimeloyl-ACP methyl ester carboxylesterase
VAGCVAGPPRKPDAPVRFDPTPRPMLDATMAHSFVFEGHRIAYEESGSGDRTVILIHGLTLNRKMQQPLAAALAGHGYRVINVDLLGHGESDRPERSWAYSMTRFGRLLLALIDHLEVDDAVLFGTSLGANSSLEAAVADSSKIRGMVIEMPVLEHSLIAIGATFLPLFALLRGGEPVMRVVARGLRRVPTKRIWGVDVLLDTVRQDPRATSAVLLGLFFGRVAPPRAERIRISVPTLVIGHHVDPVHPFSDAGMLAGELPQGRLLEASSILELRIAPERLTNEIARYLDGLWPEQASETSTAASAERR